MPVGRAYCFAAELDGKPAVFIDSIEFLESFPAGPEVRKAVVQLMKDLANHFNVPVAIENTSNGRISNRPWVNETISGAKLEKRTLNAQKLGDNVYAEHIEVRPDSMAVFMAKPTTNQST